MTDIIIPMYNCGNTITKTLDSILSQDSISNINVYLIDDCSDDNYDDVIEKYSKRISISYFRLDKNSGPGVAREYGLKKSKGDYVVFLDSDDELYSSNSISILLENIKNNDIVLGMISRELEDGSFENLFHDGCLHGKMYKRSIIDKNNISFPNSYNHEDHVFNRMYLCYSNNINYIEDIIYKYNYKESSVSRKIDPVDNIRTYINCMSWLYKNLKNNENLNKEYAGFLIFDIMVYLYYNYINNSNIQKVIIEESSYLKKMFDKYTKYLIEEEKIGIYNNYEAEVIPDITFYNFLDVIKKEV